MRILRVIRWEQHAYDSTAYSPRGISGPGSESDVYDCRMPVGERSIVMSVSVCPQTHQILCMLPMAVARSFSGGVAIRYVLSVICIGNENVPKIIINNTINLF